MKALCRAGDGSSGQHVTLARMNGHVAWRDGSTLRWDLHRDLGPCQGPVPASLCTSTRPIRGGLCLVLGPQLTQPLGAVG